MHQAVRIAVLVGLSLSVTSSAFAYSKNVRKHCRADYMTHCSAHPVGSKGVRECMRNVGPNLRPECIDALAEAGETGEKKTKKRVRRASH